MSNYQICQICAEESSPDNARCDECEQWLSDTLGEKQERIAKLEAELVDATRVCDKPGCCAAVVRSESGARRCAAGHPSRWVEKADLGRALAQVEAWRTAAEIGGCSGGCAMPCHCAWHQAVSKARALDEEQG